MTNQDDLIKSLCKALAFHLIETEITLQMTEGDTTSTEQACTKSRELIKQAGYDIDELYPVDQRPRFLESLDL